MAEVNDLIFEREKETIVDHKVHHIPEAIYPYSSGVRGGLLGGLAMIPVALVYGQRARHLVPGELIRGKPDPCLAAGDSCTTGPVLLEWADRWAANSLSTFPLSPLPISPTAWFWVSQSPGHIK